MQYGSFTANDGTGIAYQTSIPLNPKREASTDLHSKEIDIPMQHEEQQQTKPKTCILLLHGFSGSSEYFTRHNTDALSHEHWVVAPDMRGHGRSDRTRLGYHVARLAQDLHELIRTVILPSCGEAEPRIYAVGCSIGAAVLWTYIELFTDRDFSGFIFVDQAPLQDRSLFDAWGPELAHYGCYNEATMLEAQRCWASEDEHVREETYTGLVAACLGYRHAPLPGDETNISKERRGADEAFFTGISRACDGRWLARLLADHTRYDHREAIEAISRPVLVFAGRRSGCFSLEGMREIVRRVEKGKESGEKAGKGESGQRVAEMIVFESGHWLFWEEPVRFNREVLGFVERCEKAR